jgi:hypothetical protein
MAEPERAIRSYESVDFTVDATLSARSYEDDERHDRVIMSITRDAFTQEQLQRNDSK